MTAKQFSDEFKDLMTRALQGPEVPIGQMICDLEVAQHRVIHLKFADEQQREMESLATGIIKPNGMKLPPLKPPGT